MLVSISQKLLDAVGSKVSAMRDAELNTVGEIYVDLKTNPDPQLLSELLWGKYQHIGPQIPKKWLRPCDGTRVTVRYEDCDYDVRFLFSEDTKAPLDVERYGCTEDRFIDPHASPAVLEIVQRMAKLREINERWGAIRVQINTFLNKCKSLNEALKLWPSMAPYVPQNYMDKVNTKAGRTKRDDSEAKKALANINTDIAAASAVIARFSGHKA